MEHQYGGDNYYDHDYADLSVNRHTEIPDKSSGSTSRSAARCCQVQCSLVIIIIVMMIMMMMIMIMMIITMVMMMIIITNRPRPAGPNLDRLEGKLGEVSHH